MIDLYNIERVVYKLANEKKQIQSNDILYTILFTEPFESVGQLGRIKQYT